MKIRLFNYIIFLGMLCFVTSAFSQTISLDMPQYEDYLRREQLKGNLRSSISFNIRPISVQSRVMGDSSLYKLTYGQGLFKPLVNKKSIQFSLTPISTTQQYVTHHPFKLNDGAMIASTGYQTVFSAGFYGSVGPFSIQFKPQWVYAQNKEFQGFPIQHDDGVWSRAVWSSIDLPERFGNKPINKFFPSNSSVKLNVGPFSAGMSTENIWWGPCLNNPLLFSNHAPGFLHATINTRRPIKTKIGWFETQMIMGKLMSSGFEPPQKVAGQSMYQAKMLGSRYINAIIFSYSPSFLKGLSMGFTRSIQMYEQERKRVGGWLFALDNVARKNDRLQSDEDKRDQLASIFTRYFNVENKYELYAEWGRADAFFNLRDLMQAADHTQGYTVGFRKIFEKNKDEYQLLIEATHLQKNSGYFNRLSPSWYVHATVRHGFTNKGEVLGSYIGPGSNMQMMRFSRHRGMNQIAVQLERTVQNVDFYQEAFSADQAAARKWVDCGISLIGDHGYKQFLFSAKLTALRSFNYQWYQPISTSTMGANNSWDINNFLLQLGITYRW